MTAYALYEIDLNSIKTVEEREAATRKMPDMYFDKLRDAEDYCGIKLARQRNGFSGMKGNTEYIAFKITA